MDAETPARVALRATTTAGLAGPLADAGTTVVDGDADPDAVVVAGERALRGLAGDPPAAPVVHVADRPGPLTVARADLSAALAGRLVRSSHPVLGVSLGEDPVGRAAADVTLVTEQAARISEYAVRASGRRLDAFRADGVVVATPLGSTDYTRAVGGPVVGPDAGLAVVPVAEFTTDRSAWTLVPPVTLTVERDEGPVSLVLDGESVATVPARRPVRVETVASIELLRPVDGVERF